jgi:hypothetical protein
MKYIAHFTGRLNGAIGITYPITEKVEAPDEEKARLELYRKYEMIHQIWFEKDKED